MPTPICILSTKRPYQGHYAREALDTALASAAFNIPTCFLLMGDGVYQFLAQQHPEQLPKKTLVPIFKSLALYDIETVYIDVLSLHERNLTASQLLPNHTLLSQSSVHKLLKKHHRILSF